MLPLPVWQVEEDTFTRGIHVLLLGRGGRAGRSSRVCCFSIAFSSEASSCRSGLDMIAAEGTRRPRSSGTSRLAMTQGAPGRLYPPKGPAPQPRLLPYPRPPGKVPACPPRPRGWGQGLGGPAAAPGPRATGSCLSSIRRWGHAARRLSLALVHPGQGPRGFFTGAPKARRPLTSLHFANPLFPPKGL